jgi:hypothetical protein
VHNVPRRILDLHRLERAGADVKKDLGDADASCR